MARLNKLDCEYTLEEAKNVDANDITTHPFFKKHFATSNSRPGLFSSTLYVKPDKEQDHVIHYITHTPLDPHHESNIDHSKHAVKIETQHYGRTKYIGHGRGMTVHEAMDNAVHTYTHPLKIKPLTESLVGKKPATAFKLFAEEMEKRLDEISKKMLGSYVKKAVADRDELHYERDFSKRRAKEFLDNGNKEKAAEFSAEAAGISKKRAKRAIGINKAVDKLTKEDLDEVEARLDEISNKTLRSYISKSIDKEGNYHRSMITPAAEKIASRVSDSALINRLNYQDSHEMPRDPKKRAIAGITRDATHTELKNRRNPAHPMTNQPGGKQYLQGKDRIKFFTGKRVKEDLDEVEAPANFWNAGMAKMNPIQVSQKQPTEPGQFKATLTKSPKRLADQDSSLEGKPRAVRDETETVAASRGPKTIELTGDWHADVPDHQFDPKLDSETEYYPLFSQFKSLGAYPSGPARAWESEEIDEDELNEISKKLTGKYVEFAIRDRDKHIEDATKARASADALQNVRTGTNYVMDDKKRDLRDLIGDMERKAHNKKYKRERGIIHALSRLTKEDLDEYELNEISKKTLASYATKAVDELGISANVAGGATGANHYQKHLEMLHAKKRARGIKKAVKKLSEDSASLMATATKDEKKAAEQDKKKPAEFKKLHDKHEAEVKSKMKELGEETLNEISKKTSSLKKFKVYTPKYDTHVVVKAKNKDEAHREACSTSGSAFERPDVKITRVPEETLEEGLFDPAKQPLLALWDEHARRSDAHGSGSRNEILKRIEDHVAKKHGQEGLKKMRLHSDLSNALKNSVSGDKGHLQALLGNMRAKCAMEQ